MLKRSTKDQDVFLDRVIMKNIAELAIERNFKTSDTASMSTLCDVVKGFVTKIATETKNCSELSCRTDSNLIDTLTGLKQFAGIDQKSLIKHMEENPFKNICWEKGDVKNIMREQQKKADEFTNTLIKKTPDDEKEEGGSLAPEEIRNFRGFTAIPPFLRIFPSKLALQNLTKKPYEEVEEKSQILNIKNKRDIEDKLVKISSKKDEEDSIEKSDESKESSNKSKEDDSKSKKDHQEESKDNPEENKSDDDDLFEDKSDKEEPKPSENLNRIVIETGAKQGEDRKEEEIPEEIMNRESDEVSTVKIKKRILKGARKIQEAENLFV